VDLVDSSLYVQDVGRFLFTYPISSGDLVWTVGCHGEMACVIVLHPAQQMPGRVSAQK